MQVTLHFAGAGIFCSMKDYLALLRHLLQILGKILIAIWFCHNSDSKLQLLAGTANKPIIQAASLRTFFQPTLTPEGEQALTLLSPMLRGIGDSWGNGLCVNTVDIPGKRRKGSGWCESES
jgi:hypothetical protein